MKSMSLTNFRKDIFKVTESLKNGEKIYLTLKGEVVLEIKKKV